MGTVFSIPEDREVEWIRAYSNLIYLKNLNIANLFIIHYEELRISNESFAAFLDQVIPSDNVAVDFSFFHKASAKMRLQDRLCGYKPSPALVEVSTEFGYTPGDLVTKKSVLRPLWRGFRERIGNDFLQLYLVGTSSARPPNSSTSAFCALNTP